MAEVARREADGAGDAVKVAGADVWAVGAAGLTLGVLMVGRPPAAAALLLEAL